MSYKKSSVSILFFVFFLCFSAGVLAQVKKKDSILQKNIERKLLDLTNSDYKLGSGVGYIVFKVRNKRVHLLEANCSNTELYKRLCSLDSVLLNDSGIKNTKTVYFVCMSYISVNGKTDTVFWNNNQSYFALQELQWGAYRYNVTVLKPILIHTRSAALISYDIKK